MYIYFLNMIDIFFFQYSDTLNILHEYHSNAKHYNTMNHNFLVCFSH